MKIGVTAWSFESLSLQGSIALCHALGFERVDIAAFHKRGNSGLEPDEVGQNPEHFADLVKREVELYEMEVPDFFPIFGAALDERSLNDPRKEVREKNRESMKGIIRFCRLAGIPGISLSPGVHHPQIEFSQNMETSIKEFQYLVELAGEEGITIRVEPHMHAIADTPERTMTILQQVSGLKVTLDYAHFMLQYIPMERSHLLLPFTDHVHVRQSRMGKMQTRTVEGTIDYADIASRLAALDYKGVFSLEYVHMDWYDCNQVDCLNETLNTKRALTAILEGK